VERHRDASGQAARALMQRSAKLNRKGRCGGDLCNARKQEMNRSWRLTQIERRAADTASLFREAKDGLR
jgi:hypothetical protein